MFAGCAVRAEKFKKTDDRGAFYDSQQYRETIAANFSCVYPENALKFSVCHPEEEVFDFSRADDVVDWAIGQGKQVRGNCLVWGNGNPPWLAQHKRSQKLLEIMEAHIQAVVDRYRGKIAYWDVVNEAVIDDCKNLALRDNIWRGGIGNSYIQRAFEVAHEANPAASLFYCDYRIKNRAKWDFIYQILEDLRAKGTPIHGVAIQVHSNLIPSIPIAEIRYWIRKFKQAGYLVHLPECVVWAWQQGIGNQWIRQQHQAAIYRQIIEVAIEEGADMVGFWSPFDAYPWTWNGKEDEPGLWDRNFQAKPSAKILELLNGRCTPSATCG